MTRDELVSILAEEFKAGWAGADTLGLEGHRTERGMHAALDKLDELFDDEDTRSTIVDAIAGDNAH